MPKPVRDSPRLATPPKVVLEFDEGSGTVTLEPIADILDIAG